MSPTTIIPPQLIRTINKKVTTPHPYSFNGMEKDDEVKGEGNSYTTLFRQYDPSIGRWLSLDPKMTEMPWQSPYISMDDNPIAFMDPLGDKIKVGAKKEEKPLEKEENTNSESHYEYNGDGEGNLSMDEIKQNSQKVDNNSGEAISRTKEEIAKRNEEIKRENTLIRAQNDIIDSKLALLDNPYFDVASDENGYATATFKEGVSEEDLPKDSDAYVFYKAIKSSKTYDMAYTPELQGVDYTEENLPFKPRIDQKGYNVLGGKNNINMTNFMLMKRTNAKLVKDVLVLDMKVFTGQIKNKPSIFNNELAKTLKAYHNKYPGTYLMFKRDGIKIFYYYQINSSDIRQGAQEKRLF